MGTCEGIDLGVADSIDVGVDGTVGVLHFEQLIVKLLVFSVLLYDLVVLH